jgi:RimJ/RimL family protein N-acetyltransferase
MTVAGSLETFSTDRLRAERLTPAHLPDVIRMNQDAGLMTHLGGVRDEAWSAEYLDRNVRHWEMYGFGIWILRERDGTDAIGRAVLRHLPVDGVDEIEVGYAFFPRFWGRGLATEVTAACLGLARERLRLTQIVAITTPANVASQRVLIKSGLTYERDIMHDGSLWSLFRRRWPAAGGRQGR